MPATPDAQSRSRSAPFPALLGLGAATNFFAIGLLALGVQQAAMVPIQQTLAANTERLAR